MNAAVAPARVVVGSAVTPDSGSLEGLQVPRVAPVVGAHPVVGNAPANISPNAHLAGANVVPVKSQCSVRGPDDDK